MPLKCIVCTSKIVGFQVLLNVLGKGLIEGHLFEDVVMQAWVIQPGQDRYETLYGPTDPVTKIILLPPVRNPPPLANPNVPGPRGCGEPLRPRLGQNGNRTNKMVVDWTGQVPNVTQDSVPLQPLPAASIPTRGSCNNFDAVVAPALSPYAVNLDQYQQRLGQFSASVSDPSDFSDFSRTLHNTPDLASSSRNSSLSAIPDAYLPARNSSYGGFHFVPGSPYPNHISSISNTSNPSTTANSRNQSGSSHTLQDTSNDDACKVMIRHVRAGVTHEEISELLDQKMPSYSYVQYERPKRGENNKWSVKFSKKEDAEKAKERLNGFDFKERKLKVHLSNGSHQGQINSDA